MKNKEVIEEYKKSIFFTILKSPQELRDWVYLFLDMDLPYHHIDEESTSDSINAMYEIYCAIRDNTGDVIPGYILLSSRSSFKTLSASIVEVLLFVHFRIRIGHLAAILDQSEVAIQYINSFLMKLEPYLFHHGWKKLSENKKQIVYQTEKGEKPIIKIVTCTRRGANSFHCTALFFDEVDVVQDPSAYAEAQSIPDVFSGRHPVVVRLSTRKYAFGLMNREIERINISKEKILRWNILDVTEGCSEDRHLPSLPKIKRFVGRNLPLIQYTEEEFKVVVDSTKSHEYEEIELYSGCGNCYLAPICRGKLASHKYRGDFYKPIDATINNFRSKAPDYAEAQLLCWKPSTKGLVYGRFADKNIISIADAFKEISGIEQKHISFEQLIMYLNNLGISTSAGVDWGCTHESAFIVGTTLPNGDFWILDTFSSPGLELEDLVRVGLELQEKFNISKFYCDTAYPAYLKTFNKKGLNSPTFKKDVMMGVECVRSQIVNSSGKRRLKVIATENNAKLIEAFRLHSFKLDQAGNTLPLAADDEYKDKMDALRYLAQNLFGSKKGVLIGSDRRTLKNSNDPMKAKLKELCGDSYVDPDEKKRRNKKIFML
jgi:hypothetical protein